jgi:hypothetical protein
MANVEHICIIILLRVHYGLAPQHIPALLVHAHPYELDGSILLVSDLLHMPLLRGDDVVLVDVLDGEAITLGDLLREALGFNVWGMHRFGAIVILHGLIHGYVGDAILNEEREVPWHQSEALLP